MVNVVVTALLHACHKVVCTAVSKVVTILFIGSKAGQFLTRWSHAIF